MGIGEWFTISAVVPPLGVLFGFAFGLFAKGAMSNPVELFLLIIAAFGMGILTWINAVKIRRHAGEANEKILIKLEEIKQRMPEATVADVARIIKAEGISIGASAATGISNSFANTPLTLRVEAEEIKGEKEGPE